MFLSSCRSPMSSELSVIHGWRKICSKLGRSSGRYARHQRIKDWHSAKEQNRKKNISNCFILQTRQHFSFRKNIHPVVCRVKHTFYSWTAIVSLLEIQDTQELTFRDTLSETGCSLDDVSVSFKWNISTHHVKQQDAQRPDGERKCFVTLMKDPLRWAVNSGS